jgi:hypothetical protein
MHGDPHAHPRAERERARRAVGRHRPIGMSGLDTSPGPKTPRSHPGRGRRALQPASSSSSDRASSSGRRRQRPTGSSWSIRKLRDQTPDSRRSHQRVRGRGVRNQAWQWANTRRGSWRVARGSGFCTRRGRLGRPHSRVPSCGMSFCTQRVPAVTRTRSRRSARNSG